MSRLSSSIEVQLKFDAAHRIPNHKGKCKFLHGHGYILSVKIFSNCLDEFGFVADFGDVKRILKIWINQNLDHTCILSLEDKVLGDFLEKLTGQKIYYLSETENVNPTAENISIHLFEIFESKLKALNPNLELIFLKIQESEDTSAFVAKNNCYKNCCS